MVRGAGIGLGCQSLTQDLGISLPVRVWTDSSAAIGICSRQGLGKVRHLDTHTLWVQQAVRVGRIDLRKISGESNPADLLTKHSLTRERMSKLVDLYNCKFRGGRAAAAPQVRQTPGTRMTIGDATAAMAVDSGVAIEESIDPIMPHSVYSPEELRRRYPPLEVPKAVDDGDPLGDLQDEFELEGMKEADEIMAEARERGRRRIRRERRRRSEVCSACIEFIAS